MDCKNKWNNNYLHRSLWTLTFFLRFANKFYKKNLLFTFNNVACPFTIIISNHQILFIIYLIWPVRFFAYNYFRCAPYHDDTYLSSHLVQLAVSTMNHQRHTCHIYFKWQEIVQYRSSNELSCRLAVHNKK